MEEDTFGSELTEDISLMDPRLLAIIEEADAMGLLEDDFDSRINGMLKTEHVADPSAWDIDQDTP